MTPEQFIYWLQGYMEIADPKNVDEKQIQIIKDHISLVLKKETPDRAVVPQSPLVKGIEDWIQKSTSPYTPSTGSKGLCLCGSALCSICSSKLIVTC